jgi:hypothetical protein
LKSYRLIPLALIICSISACNGTRAVAGETWTVTKILTQGESIESVTEPVDVRNCCGVVEKKSVSCSAGTQNELSLSFGGSTGFQAGAEISIDASVETVLGFSRESGESLELESPLVNYAYRYSVTKTFTVIAGEALMRSSNGNEQPTAYKFLSRCSLKIEPNRETFACQETCPFGIAPESTSAQATQPPLIVLTASPSKYNFISLRNVGKAESGNLGLQAGVMTLAGVDFEIGWLATTQSTGDPNNSDKIVLSVQSISDPSKVHFLFQGSWAVNSGQEFGSIHIAFADGHTINEPLIVGYNIRDWSQVSTLLTAPNAQQAWRGVGWDGRTEGVVDMLTVDVPTEYRQSQIVQIEIRDESAQKLNSSNPGIHLWAVTIER